jgi:hypothetical protein
MSITARDFSNVEESDCFVNEAWYFTPHSQNELLDEEIGKIPEQLRKIAITENRNYGKS